MMVDRRLVKRLIGGLAALVAVALFAGFVYGMASGDEIDVANVGEPVANLAVGGSSDGDTTDSSQSDSGSASTQVVSDQVVSAETNSEGVVTESALVGSGDSLDSDPEDEKTADASEADSNEDASKLDTSDSDTSKTDASKTDAEGKGGDRDGSPVATENNDESSPSSSSTSTIQDAKGSNPPTTELRSAPSTSAKTTSTAAKRTTTTKPATTTSKPVVSDGKFRTLSPGASLPSSSQCAARVRTVAENVPENRSYNQTRGRRPSGTYLGTDPNFDGSSYEARIDGNFTGSTDEIIQWAACKWGFDEDILRAQVYTESSWFAGKLGDCNEGAQARTGGQGGCSSVGLIQVRSAGVDRNPHPGLFPISWESSAMNLDYAMAVMRLCYEGDEVWLSNISSNYQAGDQWNCMGRWFSGSWADAGSKNYQSKVRQNLNARPWEGQWVGCKDWRESFYCSGIDRPTVN